jgi:hypothetical protein
LTRALRDVVCTPDACTQAFSRTAESQPSGFFLHQTACVCGFPREPDRFVLNTEGV